MDYSSIFVLMVSYTLVFAVNDYFETKHGNEYQVLKENIVLSTTQISQHVDHTLLMNMINV